MALAVGIVGASGRMGKELISAVAKDPSLSLIGGVASPDSPYLGCDLYAFCGLSPCGIEMKSSRESALPSADVVIDFSIADTFLETLAFCREKKKSLVVGTTGLTDVMKKEMEAAAQVIPLVFSANFSLGINAMSDALALLCEKLTRVAYIDIIEMHRAEKKDSPSGTALALARAMKKPYQVWENGAVRSQEAIAIHSIRTAEIAGEHRVRFCWGGEQIEITHTVTSREAFAKGALAAAKFLSKQPAGLYTFQELCNL